MQWAEQGNETGENDGQDIDATIKWNQRSSKFRSWSLIV